MTKDALLKLYPQINKQDLENVLEMADCEPETEDGVEVMPYWYAVNAKRMLVDGDSFTETFDN
ncbi:temperature-sensitive replication protein, partial [Lactobacillus amylovorus]